MSYIETVRSRAGKRKLFLAFASVVLRSETGAVLLQRRTDFDTWGLPGGLLELGESIWDCARRELREETGLECGELALVGEYSDPRWEVVYPNGDCTQQYTVCFQARPAGGALQADGQETSDLRFFAPEEIPFEALADYYRHMIRDALAGGEAAFSPPAIRPDHTPQLALMQALMGEHTFIGVGAAAVIGDEAGRILMVRRAEDGEWDFPGGYLHLGENASHCALRTAREQTGQEIELEGILGLHSSPRPWPYPPTASVQQVATIFRAHFRGGRLPEGAAEAAWFTPEEIRRQGGNPALVELKRGVLASMEAGVRRLKKPIHR